MKRVFHASSQKTKLFKISHCRRCKFCKKVSRSAQKVVLVCIFSFLKFPQMSHTCVGQPHRWLFRLLFNLCIVACNAKCTWQTKVLLAFTAIPTEFYGRENHCQWQWTNQISAAPGDTRHQKMVVPKRKCCVCHSKNVFGTSNRVNKIVQDLAESIMNPSGPVKEELRRKMIHMIQF